MFPAAVQVNTASGITLNEHPPAAVALQPVGIVQPVIAFVPETWNNGPLGRVVPATEATVAETAGEAIVFPNPGTHTFDPPVPLEQIH